MPCFFPHGINSRFYLLTLPVIPPHVRNYKTISYMTANTDTAILGTEKIPTLLLRYAIPSIIAMTAASVYNIVDSIFIGHGVGDKAISGLTSTLPLMNLAAAFGAMIGIGASSLMSIKLGQNDKESAMSILGNTVMLNIIIGLTFGITCLIFLDKILYLFGASDNTIMYARDYMKIILAGNVFTHLYLGLNNTLRASGFPKKSMTAMITAIILNCILDWLFIFVLGLGIKGAAYATVIAQMTAMLVQGAHFCSSKHEIHFTKGIFKIKKKIVKGILSIGMAPFLMNVSASIVVAFINTALKNSSPTINAWDDNVGAYGIVNRIALIFLMVVFGLNQGMQPIIGYNFGAKKFDRVKKTLNIVMVAATVMTTFSFVVCFFFPHIVVKIFNPGPDLMAASIEAMKIVLFAFPIVGFQIVAISFFQSIGSAKTAIFLSLTRQLIFLLPMLIILPQFFGTRGVWMSMPISDLLSTFLAIIMLARQFRIFRKQAIII